MRTLFAISALTLIATAAGAQNPDFQWSKAEPAGTMVSVHNINGDITVVPGTGTTVEVTAIKHGDNANIYTVVKEFSGQVVVCVLWHNTDESCDKDGESMHSHDDNWQDRGSMDVTVKLPASMLAQASSVSGDVRMDGTHGEIRATSVSGDIHLVNLQATAVHATSVSGDVDVGIAQLSGSGELKFTSVSGDVTVSVPTGLDADFSMSTVSGELDTDFPMTLNGRMGRRSIDARIGKGGRELRVSTVSGDVRLRALK